MVCIVVASTSEIKIKAAREYFANEFTDIEALGVEVSSGVKQQPFGHNETLLGANNRVKEAIETNPGKDLYVGIENGIFEVTNPEGNSSSSRYFDCAWVVLTSMTSQMLPRNTTAISHSVGIEINSSMVEALKRDPGFGKQTIGSKMAEVTASKPEFNPQDPHIWLTNGRKSRKDIIREAIDAAYGQLLYIGRKS